MTQGDNLPKVGRPLADVDVDKLRQLARMGCSQAEIAQFFGVDRSTINRRFATDYEQARAECKIYLRRAQMRSVDEGSVPMQIHLGKYLLGQRDKPKAAVAGKDDGRATSLDVDIEFIDPPERPDQDSIT